MGKGRGLGQTCKVWQVHWNWQCFVYPTPMSLLTSSYWLPANVGGGGAKPKEEGTAGEGPRREAKGGIAVYAAKGSLFSNWDADRRRRKRETSRNLVCEEFAMGQTASDNFMFAVAARGRSHSVQSENTFFYLWHFSFSLRSGS